MQEFHFDHATIRVHPSSMSKEEFRANLEEAIRDFYNDIQREKRSAKYEQTRNNAPT